jgi:hypothetical protein
MARWRFFSWLAHQVDRGQEHEGQKDVHKNVVFEEEAKEIQIGNLHIEDLVDGRVARVIGKGVGRELHHGHGTHQNQSNVEEKGRHVCLAQNHGM